MAASPGVYDWIVNVPVGFVDGNYTLGLAQGAGSNAAYSPFFEVSFSRTVAGPSVTSVPTNGSMPHSATVTVWDTDCGCHKTTTTVMAAAPAATGTGSAAAPYSWYDDECGCSKTAMAPAAPTATGSNYTAPALTTATSMLPSATMSAPSTYTGAANKLTGSVLSLAVLMVAAIVA